MPDSVDFSTADDYREFSPGNIAGNGALSLIAICKPVGATLDGLYHWFFNINNIAAGFGIVNAQLEVYDGTSERVAITVPAIDEWYLIGVTKAAGTVTPRFHLYRYSTTTWTHTNGGGTIVNFPALTQLTLPHLLTETFDGNLLIAGIWDSELSDATIETLELGKASWVTAAPDEAWRFNTAGTITPFVGTSTQTNQQGGTLDVGDAPAGWSDGLEGEAPRVPISRVVGSGVRW